MFQHRLLQHHMLQRRSRLARLVLLFGIVCSLSGSAWGRSVRVFTHSSFNISTAIIEAFSQETGISVEFIEGGDAGETLNRAILTRDNPLADVLFGVDNSLIARARSADIFQPYRSPMLEHVAAEFRFDPDDLVTPISVGYVNFNYDRAWFAERGLEPPQDLDALLEPAYRGLTVVMDPATSSPGLAFMLTTIDRYGEDWLEFWAALRDNDLQVSNGWSSAYYTAFSLYGGNRPIVLSYATSPAAEVIFADDVLEQAPSGNLFCSSCVFEQIEAVGILRGARDLEAAQAFIDYMLSLEFQEDIPLNMFVYPLHQDATLPPAFDAFAPIPDPAERASVNAELLEDTLQDWLEAWTRVVLQGQQP